MANYIQPIQNLMNLMAKLPGIGARSAERIAFHILKMHPEEALKLADAIKDVKTKIKHCSICFNLTESDPCHICQDPLRDHGLVCVIEQPKDLLALEAAGSYKGVYHVLMGRIAPLEGIEPGDLTIEPLLQRIHEGTVREIIMGTNPTMEGDGTALYIQNIIQKRYPHITITRLARGLPTGSSIEFANKNILSDAISGRQKV